MADQSADRYGVELDERMVERTERAVAVMQPPERDAGTLLARLDGIRAAIDEIRTLADVGQVLGDIEKLKRYAVAVRASLDEQNALAKCWFLTQRRGGVLIATGPKQRPGQYQQRFQNGTVDIPPTLGELGITKKQAMYWQGYADYAETAFESILDDIAEARRLTTKGLVEYLDVLARGLDAERIAAEPPLLPSGLFHVIVADPPWQYAARAFDPTHRARNPYPDMSTDDICALPVGDLAGDDSVLWLWTTNSHMRDAFDVLRAWGFEHKTILTWVKDRMGTGHWLRGQTEHCLLAVKGRPTITLTNQTTALFGPLREHSRKPDEFYALVEALCPGSKVELFARQARDGWMAHGSEIIP